MSAIDLRERPLHLGLGATAVVEPPFTGEMSWYEDYMNRHLADGIEARLVVIHSFTESWPSWEMHPKGAEVVVCIGGAFTMHQEKPDGTRATVALVPGQCAINEPGTWHTADVDEQATALFITAGVGTEHRPRS